MKKVIIIAFIAIGMVLNANAQTTPITVISQDELNKQQISEVSDLIGCLPEKTVVIRGHAGAGISGITSNGFGFKGKYDMMESRPIFSYTIGVDVQLPLLKCDNFGLRTGLAFQTNGAEFSMDGYDDYDGYNYKIKLNYIKVPAIVEYDVCEKFNLFGGVKLGYLLSAKQDDGNESYDIKDELKSIDFGGVLGAEYNIYCSDKFSLGTGINYDFGLSDINDNDYSDDKSKNSALLAFIAISF